MTKERSYHSLTNSSGFVHWSDIRSDFINNETQIKNDLFAKIIGSLVMRRKQLKLTQVDLAKKIGITQSTLARIEVGDSIPKLDTFYKLVMALELNIVLIPKEVE
ncbi:helix-turn-helix domain-containing protein [Brevibacillus formosus]|uniref:helix-turn-helix domain-containing protein n=1 Tax=Brevibacillus formosus TaxID=54913 RepID=UPI001C66B9CF|nr:helix-turn-helix transcriptional regulator [Brevibacillus formosus]MBW5470429.1 helix-turn-helix domain-containing protein [Brevibacillus formosus]